MLTDAQKKLIQKTWKLVVPISETAADLFYKRLFETHPEYRKLFGEDMSSQKRKLLRMLAFVVKSVDWADDQWREDVDPNEDLMLVVLALGRRHTELYKIPDESYGAVGAALLWTLDYGLGEAFTEDARAAWTAVYTILAATMKMGCQTFDQSATLNVRDAAKRIGEEALLEGMAEAGIDEARLGFPEEAL
jgi:hemoglobin-like flavoprotein